MAESLERNRIVVGSVDDRSAAFLRFEVVLTALIKSRKINMAGVTREIFRCNSSDFHYYDGEALARLRRALAVWVDMGSEEDSAGPVAMIQALITRTRNPQLFTVVAMRSLKEWANDTKIKVSLARDLAEAFHAA
jgi:hypothetical protein